MEIKISCACGELTYRLPEPIASSLEALDEETRKSTLRLMEESLHEVTNSILTTFALAGPVGAQLLFTAIREAVIPFRAASTIISTLSGFHGAGESSNPEPGEPSLTPEIRKLLESLEGPDPSGTN